jgi:hypothetical protein
MALKQTKDMDEEAGERLYQQIADTIWAADVSWLTAMAACQQALCMIMLNVECPHCRRNFVDGGYVETMQPLLDDIRKGIEEDESSRH